jgi:membrane-associated phospholipid phosphatase
VTALRPADRGVRTGIVAVVVLLVAAAGVSNVYASSGNPVKDHPAPTLFSDAQIAPLGAALAAQKARADQLFAAWSAAHPTRDDAGFAAFALAQVPPVPDAATQARELAELHVLADARTPQGMAAASWLEVYGKKDVWKLYLRDATETWSAAHRARAAAVLKADTALAKSMTATAQARFGRPAPTVVDPSLRQGARRTKLSYPSKHAVYVCSELAVLTALDPGRAAEFRHLTDEVAYSRLYAAGHYRSDLVAGALVGDLLGDYEVRGLGGG